MLTEVFILQQDTWVEVWENSTGTFRGSYNTTMVEVLQHGAFEADTVNVTVRIWREYSIGKIPPIPPPGDTGGEEHSEAQYRINTTATAIVVFTLLGALGLIILRPETKRRRRR